MSEKNVYLGIDTSNYTTSAALCSEDGLILLNCKLPLPVKEGERGLRQSDAVFHHVKNLPEAAENVGEYLKDNCCKIEAVGYSSAPRNISGSYMPCFLAGESAAEFSAKTLGVPIYKTSHQAGHIMAALYSACQDDKDKFSEIAENRFIAFHVSGGTTDVLLCEPDTNEIFKIEQIGGSRDINGGQAVDRAGVMMGLSFPCGAEMDRAAIGFNGKTEKSKLSVDGTYCNLSGLENKAAEKYKKTGSIAETSAYVLDFIARTLEKITQNVLDEYGNLPVIYAGGVMSSEYIRRTLGQYGMFADARFSSDNAAGVALITREKHIRTTK
ncbi:MAG: peptidase M22 [Eubacteriales bacterium]